MMINLASQPFRRERAQNAVWALVCAALVCSLFVMAMIILRERALGIVWRAYRERTELLNFFGIEVEQQLPADRVHLAP